MSNFPPTPEQQEIIDAFKAGLNVVASAGAGAGKTSTLVFLAQANPTVDGLYVAFNKSIQLDAEKKFKGTKCQARTAHSLAYHAILVRGGYKQRFDSSRKPDWKTLRAFIGARDFQLDSEHTIPTKVIISAVRGAHRNYCKSAEETLSARHIEMPPLPEGIDGNGLRNYILQLATKYSADCFSKTGTMPFGFDEYLKLYQLSKPVLKVKFIVFDEAQDANPVIADIINRQNCQKVMVGDENQQIYEWNGAVNAMGKFGEQDGVKTLALTQSFRFGPAIAEAANEWLTALESTVNGEPFRLRGFDKIDSKVSEGIEANAVLCRTNGGCLTEALEYLSQGKTVALVGGGQDIKNFAFAARELQMTPRENGKGGTDHPELCAFNSWEEVLQYIEEGDAEQSLKSLVRIISQWGVGKILHILGSLVDEEKADVVISTAHKAKGREWDRVRISGDFKAPEEGNDLSKSEARLAYVAVTRAKQELEKGGLNWITAYLLDRGLVTA